MRLKLHLQRIGKANVLPLNYQYPISAWIYHTLEQADESFSAFLHNHGYTTARKSFKFFTFSGLQVADFRIQGDRMAVLSPSATLHVHFYLDKPAETFVRGLFQSRQCRIYDRQSEACFEVAQVEVLPLEVHTETVRLRTLSPLVVGRKNRRGHDDYLAPDDPEYASFLQNNLVDKYLATRQPLRPEWADFPFAFRPLGGPPKSRLVTIKAEQESQTKIRGYLFDFELTAPRPLLELGLLAGLGRYNADGFGCCELKP